MVAFEATGLPARRPNTMNALGLVINDIGLEPLMSSLLARLMAPLVAALFPSEMICTALDHHHSFMVRYKTQDQAAFASAASSTSSRQPSQEGTTGLDMHHDAAEATLNVCLGRGRFRRGLGVLWRSRHTRPSTVSTDSHTRDRACDLTSWPSSTRGRKY